MKIPLLLTAIFFIGLHSTSVAQTEMVCGTDASQAELFSPTETHGIYLPAQGDLKVLVVFARFKDDNTSHFDWPVGSDPYDFSTWIDPTMQTGSSHFVNFTNYFNQMSQGTFRVIGTAVSVETPENESYYSSRYQANKDVLQQKVDPLVNFSDFDNWTFDSTYHHTNQADGIVDMIVMIWRGQHFGQWGGEASLGYGSSYSVESGTKTIAAGYRGFGQAGSGVTVHYLNNGRRDYSFHSAVHEVAHWLLGGPHPYGSGGGHAKWGMLGGSFEDGVCANSYERERLGWISPALASGSASLSDFITGGAAYKFHPPGGATNEYYYFENHQKLSVYDDATSNPNDKGIWILHQQDVYNNSDNIRIKPQDGFWNWENPYFNTTCFPPNSVGVFRKLSVNRNSPGRCNRDQLLNSLSAFEWPHSYVGQTGSELCGGFFRGDPPFFGAFNTTINNVFSRWSNPTANTWTDVSVGFAMEVISQDGSTLMVTFYTADPQAASPSKPQDLHATKNAEGAASLTWTTNIEPDLAGYNVYRAIYYSGGPTPTYARINSSLVTSPSFVDNNWSGVSIPFGATSYFRYRVTAVDNQAKESVMSDSAEVSYTWQEYLLGLAYQNKSASSQGTAFNGQRKLYRESSGKLHEVFASGTINGGEVFYRRSTDNGATWNVTTRLSDGTATSLAPCITVGPGPTVIVVWQQTNGSNYNVVFSRSTNGGSSWSSITTLQSHFSCASPGPLLSVSANILTGGTVVVYRTSSGLRYVSSTTSMSSWSSPATIPNTNGNYNSPTTAFYPVASPMVDKCNLAFATDVGYSSQLYYSYFDLNGGSWSSFVTLSSVLPGNYVQHRNPSLAVSTSSTTTAHVAWEATVMSPPTPVLVHRKGSSGNFGSQYSIINYQSPANPSISGLSSDNAWMVFQRTQAGAFAKVRYRYSGGQWSWDTPQNGLPGNYAQISVGFSSAKYLWTSGTSSPYTVSIGSETLSKEDLLATVYSRELNLIDTKTGSSLTLEVKQPQVIHKDGTISLISFVDTPPDSLTISTQDILTYGRTRPFVFSESTDTLKMQYALKTVNSANMLQDASATLSLRLVDVKDGGTINTIGSGTITKSSDTTNALYEIALAGGSLPNLSAGTEVAIELALSGVKEEGPELIASLGHVYSFGSEGAAEISKDVVAKELGPRTYFLEQNYPNPFNPVTQIRYSILQDGYVTLRVFDVLGREVAVLADGLRGAGVYTSEWDARDHASGVYLARLIVRDEAGNLKYQGVTKLLLAK